MPESEFQEPVAKIVQFADDAQTLPDGSKVIYAENESNIVIYHKIPKESTKTYVYFRETGEVTVNGHAGSNKEKKDMLHLGTYLLANADEDDLITLNVHEKDNLS